MTARKQHPGAAVLRARLEVALDRGRIGAAVVDRLGLLKPDELGRAVHGIEADRNRSDARHHGGRDAPRRSGEPAGEDADPAIGGHRLPDALGQRVAEACQGDRGPGAAPLGQGLIQPQGTEQHAHYHVSGENAGGGQLSLVDDDLSHGAQDTAAEKRVEIFHEMSPPLFIRAVCPVPAGLCSAARRHRSPGRDETMGRKEMFIPHPGVRRIPLLRFGL